MGFSTWWWDVVSGHLSSRGWAAAICGHMGMGTGTGIGAWKYAGMKTGNPAGGTRYSSFSLGGS